MKTPPPMTDIHCHFLPNTDDGAADLEECLDMAQMAVEDGISTILCTPHQLEMFPEICGATIRARVNQVQAVLNDRGIPLRVLPGGESRFEPDFFSRFQAGKAITLGDRNKHLLFDIPEFVDSSVEDFLDRLNAMGLVGILAHPERKCGLLHRPDWFEPLHKAGCLMQLTAGSLLGEFGPETEEYARYLVRERWVHFVATDAHDAIQRRPLLAEAFDCTASLAGRDYAVAIFCENPAAVAEGRSLDPHALRLKKIRSCRQCVHR